MLLVCILALSPLPSRFLSISLYLFLPAAPRINVRSSEGPPRKTKTRTRTIYLQGSDRRLVVRFVLHWRAFLNEMSLAAQGANFSSIVSNLRKCHWLIHSPGESRLAGSHNIGTSELGTSPAWSLEIAGELCADCGFRLTPQHNGKWIPSLRRSKASPTRAAGMVHTSAPRTPTCKGNEHWGWFKMNRGSQSRQKSRPRSGEPEYGPAVIPAFE
ncbi:hypothetical protein DFH09DRAFT_1493529 [Mycena vulgaris]|nr:hypothetical protein DFH09DRAFT_1493529 [Mycena vulgaris]